MAINTNKEAKKLPEGITQEMIDAAKEKSEAITVFELKDSNQKSFGNFLFVRPSAWAISQFEKFLDKESMKARQILINATVFDEEQRKVINSWSKNSEQYAAAFDAASQMLPVGKAEAKNV